ncbi:MAG: hypothetical protein SPK70_06185 [Succinivibrio dextrinosolvens]|uniref:hypothetical protein n=1 Tax=Succinivibrio sp. TaxID=2053619 RepID=UPI0025FF9CB7|nr:hypothetical protein [Succinivibrio sp.]MBQ9219399.1 hypothetical protein [Succinivibrio sp.]MDY6416237.1 hypothetical protein [Succinivibrio dextrinosolvens]MDY6421358.1 hypothetical protein [Succinivibrio dextrinosolvens]MDY6470637.1 hypothetical protein [Succinivibrio dextrinosolvens]
MAEIRPLEKENFEEISSYNKELLDRIRSLTKENRELKKQLAEGNYHSEGDEHMNQHRCGQERSEYGRKCKGRGLGHGQGRGCCSKHGSKAHDHGACRGNCCHSDMSDCNENEHCCKSGRQELSHSCTEHGHNNGGCCCHH